MIANFALQIIVSLATKPSPEYIQRLVDQVRIPVGETVIPGVTDQPVPAPTPGK
jgi:hypothetical protein